MPLDKYRKKRRFKETPEPKGEERAGATGERFVVQLHAARKRHYDFRIELDGVLKSWAVPKGPSFDPKEKRLAIETEDHPVEYADFEGVIPEGQYGAGAMLLWDRGAWRPRGDPHEGYRRGNLKMQLDGAKLRGGWALVRMQDPSGTGKNWLLVKERDDRARPQDEFDVLAESPLSVASGRTLAQIAAGERSGDSGSRTAKLTARSLRGARQASMPREIVPALAMSAETPPEGEQWFHEIKFDGYRLICRIENGRVSFHTRGRQDWTDRVPRLREALERAPVRDAILDGELVALLPSGASSFQSLQNAFGEGRADELIYYVFDLLYLDGYDLRRARLDQRKAKLVELISAADLGKRVQHSDHLQGSGPEFFLQCCRMGLEGVVSKRRDRPYVSGRSSAWLKAKCVRKNEFVIAGFTESTAAHRSLGALLLGYYDPDSKLIYAGRVGTGFTDQTLRDLRGRLDGMRRDRSPFAAKLDHEACRDAKWVEPRLVAEVKYANCTDEGILRHPSFQGLREDKPAETVGRPDSFPKTASKGAGGDRRQPNRKGGRPEGERGGLPKRRSKPDKLAGVRMTHPDRILYAAPGITKIGLASYFVEVADWILPHVVGRPLSLVRCPRGQGAPCFYQKHPRSGAFESLRRVTLTEKTKSADYLVIEDVGDLVALVQMSVLEIHPWGARTDRIDRPDRLTFDLDPDTGLDWPRVVDAAFDVRDSLGELGFASFVKTTGGKGLHVVVPLSRRNEWDEITEFAEAFARWLAGRSPRRYTTTMSKEARRGKIYLDHRRNRRGATSVAPYSTRATPGATVSTPLAWDELGPALRSDHFNVNNLPARLASLRRDPWDGFFAARQSITQSVRRELAQCARRD